MHENELLRELEKLAQKFEENILDATKNFKKLITDKTEIQGLPQTTLNLAAETATLEGYENATPDNGPWIITLDGPIYRSVLQHVCNRSLREEVFRANLTRALYGTLNNTSIIECILQLRLEKAKLLGFSNYAEVSFKSKMAPIEKAKDLIEKLHDAFLGSCCSRHGRSTVFSTRLPIAHVICNQTPPSKDKPSLMTTHEVETVFHEFGHALQHMLSKLDEGLVLGTKGIEWNAVDSLSVHGELVLSKVFLDFRGREPTPNAFLRYNGLLPAIVV